MREPLSPTAVLTTARKLISARHRWAKGANARDVYGKGVPPSNKWATCFCAAGAVIRASQFYGKPPRELEAVRRDAMDHLNRVANARNVFASVRDGHAIVDYNDARATTHADIMSAFDNAIAASRAATN